MHPGLGSSHSQSHSTPTYVSECFYRATLNTLVRTHSQYVTTSIKCAISTTNLWRRVTKLLVGVNDVM